MSKNDSVQKQYERWPYPYIPLLARVNREQLWQINLQWLSARCGQELDKKKPRIWIVGCGTFQPYVFSLANPGAEILATDISNRSLSLAKRRCRFHGIKNVSFAQVDLEKEEQLPEGPFDLIECYGVLMSLQEPEKVLQQLAKRLSPNGVLRLMVYPHYSRQRIFQVQRLARLLGLSYEQPKHPQLLRKFMAGLPKSHPLHYSFFSYHDSNNPEGIVDGFLHASDQAFTGIETCAMADKAGLSPAFYFHRPWGQPRIMGEKLGLEKQSEAFLLHYLDLWQELRTNFVICFVRKENALSSTDSKNPQAHPLLNLKNPDLGWRHRMRLRRLQFTGVQLSSRTHESALKVKNKEMLALLEAREEKLSPQLREILVKKQSSPKTKFPKELKAIVPNPEWKARVGEFAVNPLYSHLFDAYLFDRQWNGVLAEKLPKLSEQVQRWKAQTESLEDELHPFGLTPLGTYLHNPAKIEAALEKETTVHDFDSAKLPDEPKKLEELQRLLKGFPGLSRRDFKLSELRELWILIFSHRELFLSFQES